MRVAKKIHYKYGCDRRLQRNNWGDLLHNVTDDLQKVDCKYCLKIIKDKKLQPRSSFPEVPTFDVVAHGYWKHKEGEAQCYLTFTCPVCGQVNVHGGLYGKIGAADGPITSPCNCWEKDYYIREV